MADRPDVDLSTPAAVADFLQKHNQWRRVGGELGMHPSDIGEALDAAVAILRTITRAPTIFCHSCRNHLPLRMYEASDHPLARPVCKACDKRIAEAAKGRRK